MNRLEKILSHHWEIYHVSSGEWNEKGNIIIRSKCKVCGLHGIRGEYMDKRYANARLSAPHNAVPEALIEILEYGESTIAPISCEEMMIKDLVE